MNKLFKRLAAIAVVAMMVMTMGITAFAATPTTCKFTKADGSDLKMNMDTGLIDTVDLTDGKATVTFKAYELLWYKGTISSITGEAVKEWYPDTGTAVIDMSNAGADGIAGVPVHITFSFNTTPPGMSNSMDARFVCE